MQHIADAARLGIVDGAAAKRREAGAEHQPGIDRIDVLDDLLAQAFDRGIDEGKNEPVLEVEVRRSRRTLPHRAWRRVAGGTLTGTLVLGAAPFWPEAAVQVAVVVAVAWVTWSFLVDGLWLERT